jgi:hypothetical protein
MSGIFTDGVRQLEQMGVLQVIVPFVLIFVLVYGILIKVKIFEKNSINSVIAIVIGIIPVFQHVLYPNSKYDVVPIINSAIPQVGVVLIAILMLMIILGIFGKSLVIGGNKASGWVIALAVIIILYIFGSSAGLGFYDLPYWLRDRQVWALLVVLLFFGLIIKFITGDDKPEDKEKTFFENLAELTGGKKDKE